VDGPERHRCAKIEVANIQSKEPSVEEISRIFVDTSKQVFQLHGVDVSEQVVVRRKLRRAQFLAFFAGLRPTVVGLEACAASHHWARELMALGHEVRLIAPQHIKPYVKRNKNDARDAEAGCEAMSRPTMGFVPAKTVEQQGGLMLLKHRERLVAERTRLSNAIRGHAAEFGWVAAAGLDKIPALVTQALEAAQAPAAVQGIFRRLGARFAELQGEIAELDREIRAWRKRSAISLRLAELPGVGELGSMMLPLKTPDPCGFKSGRDFAAWIGLTARDHSTAGKLRLGVITKAGDEALRAVLVAGAMSVIRQVLLGRGPQWPWLAELLQRKPRKLAAVALANKLARIAWKMMVSGEAFDPARLSPAAAA
jgi:transposase